MKKLSTLLMARFLFKKGNVGKMENKKEDKIIPKQSISVKETARLLGKSEQFVRIGLQRKILSFGVAIKMPNRQSYTYHISPNALYEYLKIK